MADGEDRSIPRSAACRQHFGWCYIAGTASKWPIADCLPGLLLRTVAVAYLYHLIMVATVITQTGICEESWYEPV